MPRWHVGQRDNLPKSKLYEMSNNGFNNGDFIMNQKNTMAKASTRLNYFAGVLRFQLGKILTIEISFRFSSPC